MLFIRLMSNNKQNHVCQKFGNDTKSGWYYIGARGRPKRDFLRSVSHYLCIDFLDWL